MKVAVWGSYNYGNYGDDIMAIQFAKVVQGEGLEPWVYRLDSKVAKRYNVRTTDSLEELFEGSCFCLMGGGAMLEGESIEIDPDFEALNLYSSKYDCPVFPVSVGGDGKGFLTKLSRHKLSFWSGKHCQNPTVRLTSDLALLHLFDKQAVYYPDVLWSVKDFWDVCLNTQDKDTIDIGINIPNSAAARFLVQQLRLLSAVRRDLRFHFIRTYLPSSPINLELQPEFGFPYIQCHVYKDPIETFNFLSSLDLIVSHKLHLGLTGLALGVPFASLGGKDKTKAFLKELGADFAILSSYKKNYELVSLLANRKKLEQFRASYDWQLIEKICKVSQGHTSHIKQIVASIKSTSNRSL